LLACIQEAREDYRSCLDDCANAAVSHPRGRRFARSPLAVRTRSLCHGPAPRLRPARLGLGLVSPLGMPLGQREQLAYGPSLSAGQTGGRLRRTLAFDFGDRSAVRRQPALRPFPHFPWRCGSVQAKRPRSFAASRLAAPLKIQGPYWYTGAIRHGLVGG